MFQPNRFRVNVNRPRNRLQLPSRTDQNNVGIELFKASYRHTLKEYLINTTLHGLKYVGDNTTTLIER